MKRVILLALALISITIVSCREENIDVDLQANEWKVVKMKKAGDDSYDRPDEDYILTFASDTSLTLTLDINECSSTYNIPENGIIEVEEGISCTNVCCDSEFAETMTFFLSQAVSYYGKGKRLFFECEDGTEVVFKEN